MIVSVNYKPTVEQLAHEFARLDNHQMLAFFECVTAYYIKTCPRGACALYDQYLAVVHGQDMTQETCTALAHLQRDESYRLDNYKVRP